MVDKIFRRKASKVTDEVGKMNNDKTMSEVNDTVVSMVIDKAAEMAFPSGDDIIENAVQAAVEHVAGTVVDHAAGGLFSAAAENTLDFVAAPLAPARIVGGAVKDMVLSSKSPDEIGQNVRNKSFNSVFIGGMIATTGAVLSGGGLVAIPAGIFASYIVARDTSRIYGGLAQGAAWGVKGAAWGVNKIFKRT